jgi:hypothetical protein
VDESAGPIFVEGHNICERSAYVDSDANHLSHVPFVLMQLGHRTTAMRRSCTAVASL